MSPKLGKVVVADLTKRSKKGLEFAKQTLRAEEIAEPKMRDALEHYLVNWNDFTHPGLFSIACEAVGGDLDGVVPTQAAIVMMAAAFDIHDDIIDKSKVKNEIPTVYGKFGTEIALLLGNAFLIEGFKLFVDSSAMLPKEKGKSALETIKRLLFEVGNAHALEVGLKSKRNVDPNDYVKVGMMKGAGIEADMCLGALFGGGKDAEVEILAKLGRTLGKLSIMREEFIDIFDVEELSQRIAVKDFPIPLLFAIQDKEAKGKVLEIISKPKITQSDITKIVSVTLEAKPVIKLKEEMKRLIKEGVNLINSLPKTTLRKQLQALPSFMLEDL
jgi:geranylgeranyl pyrophosphate synthase